MSGLRSLHAIGVFLCGAAIGLSLAGFPRAAVILLALDVLLFIRSLETLRVAATRPENRA